MKRPSPKKPDRLFNPTLATDLVARKVEAAVWDFDREIKKAEADWGVDRLPYLVDAKRREAWWAGMEDLNQAIMANDPELVRQNVDNMTIGICMLIKAAEKAGEMPLVADQWETPLKDGRVLRIVRCWPENSCRFDDARGVVVWTLEEVARIIEDKFVVNAVKEAWPGAVVTAVRNTSPHSLDLDDEIPF